MSPDSFCRAASDLIYGDRAKTHGPFTRSLQNISTMWNAYLAIRREPSMPLGPTDVAYLMALLKIARSQSGETNPDNPIDAIAYLAFAGALNEGAPSTDYIRGPNNPGKTD